VCAAIIQSPLVQYDTSNLVARTPQSSRHASSKIQALLAAGSVLDISLSL
jgi:hypothetical protein